MKDYIEFPEKLFVTGTDTDVGKTVVSSLLLKGLSAGYWKPVQAGKTPQTDTEFVKKATGLAESHFYPERYCLDTPMSPHAAADIDGVEISLNDFNLPYFTQQHLVVEGAGGLIVPLNEKDTVLDLIEQFGLPVLLVARSGLGTLNHTFLSLMALRNRNIDIFGVLLNGPLHKSNYETILEMGRPRYLFQLEMLKNITPSNLEKAFLKIFSR
mgnify:CR=1 FL=1